jgi:hypothetical protein
VSEDRELRNIFGIKTDEATGCWRKLHNDEPHNLYSSSNIIMMIKSRRMRWAGYEARMMEMRNAYKILIGKHKGKRPLGRPKLDGRIILKWILGQCEGVN